jgi:Insulinase (Peptidase family M16)
MARQVIRRDHEALYTEAWYLTLLRGNCASIYAGIAHLLEHMAFKGSTTIGTKNYRQEAVLLDQLDEGMRGSSSKLAYLAAKQFIFDV